MTDVTIHEEEVHFLSAETIERIRAYVAERVPSPVNMGFITTAEPKREIESAKLKMPDGSWKAL
jgi:hypothetical protein